MKRILKFIVNLMAIALFSMCAFSFSACNDITTVKVEFSIYNNSAEHFYSKEDVTMSVDLYGHLAPKTVKAIKGYIKDGYFDNAFIYQLVDDYEYQYMFGDLEYNYKGEIVQKAIKPTLPGEFYSNGVYGNDIQPQAGSIGLWRSYYESDMVFNVSSEARNSGRSTLFMPTESNNTLNGYVCMFAKYDTEAETSKTVMSALDAIFSNSEYFDDYVIYYTGEYDASKPNENHGLTFNCVLSSEWDENEVENLFEPEGLQYASYARHIIRVPKTIARSGESTAKISSIKIK